MYSQRRNVSWSEQTTEWYVCDYVLHNVLIHLRKGHFLGTNRTLFFSEHAACISNNLFCFVQNENKLFTGTTTVSDLYIISLFVPGNPLVYISASDAVSEALEKIENYQGLDSQGPSVVMKMSVKRGTDKILKRIQNIAKGNSSVVKQQTNT